jgi:hypothetical protein
MKTARWLTESLTWFGTRHELQLSSHAGDGVFGSANRVFVDDVDERYLTFRARGLDTTQRPESPIHTAPVDQTWGLREFAVTDPDGNNLCFCMPNDNCRERVISLGGRF